MQRREFITLGARHAAALAAPAAALGAGLAEATGARLRDGLAEAEARLQQGLDALGSQLRGLGGEVRTLAGRVDRLQLQQQLLFALLLLALLADGGLTWALLQLPLPPAV
ncbi:MAG TPA: hypothetical protein VIX81_03245 [Gammaproteobacteria bacterium]